MPTWIITDDVIEGPYSENTELAEAVAAHTDVTLHEGKLTPELLTAMRNDSTPYSALLERNRVGFLEVVLHDICPIEEIARKSVLAEREMCYRNDGDVWGPADNTPLDSDRHEVELDDFIRANVDTEAFDFADCGVALDKACENTQESLRAKIADLWGESFGVEQIREEMGE